MEEHNPNSIDEFIRQQEGQLRESLEQIVNAYTPEPERVELGFIERIAAATLIARGNELDALRQQLDKDFAELTQQVERMADEVFKRVGEVRNPDTIYMITPDAFVKQ
jgi:hypothetical protein